MTGGKVLSVPLPHTIVLKTHIPHISIHQGQLLSCTYRFPGPPSACGHPCNLWALMFPNSLHVPRIPQIPQILSEHIPCPDYPCYPWINSNQQSVINNNSRPPADICVIRVIYGKIASAINNQQSVINNQ